MREVTEEEIYEFLLGPFVVNAMYRAPVQLRGNDSDPSFGVFEGQKGGLLWYDFGLANEDTKAVNLLMLMRGVDYRKALHIINTEVASSRLGKPPLKLLKTSLRGKIPFVTWREHRDYELQYWAQFGQTKMDLEYQNIYALDSLSYRGSSYKAISTREDPGFVYLYNGSPLSCKVYRPMNENNKFRMFNTTGVIEGWPQMMTEHKLFGKFDTLYILASTKDRLAWNTVCGSAEATINPRSEGIFKELISKKDEIDLVAYKIIVIFDSDETGYKKSTELGKKCGWEVIDMRDKMEKDIAKFLKDEGQDALRELKSKIV
jgi:hypothetical protein